MKARCLFALATVAAAAASANALTFQCRWVERVGSTDFVIGGDGATLDLGSNVGARRLRLQFSVVDDASGPAPAGGFVGWNVGSLSVSGPAANSADRRTNGRISPFNFASQPTANGNPAPAGGVNAGDAVGTDFQNLTDIDCTLGTQSPFWGCIDTDGDGFPDTPAAQPNPTIRGRNAFVSVFEITTDVIDVGGQNYSITAGGNLIAASEWRTVGTPTPPDCSDPGAPVAGSVTYAPFPTAPTLFTCTLNIRVPAPGATALLGLGGLLVARRRR